jgi:hypothetical protein
MATVARGLCLVLLAGRVVELWCRGGGLGRVRSTILALGLIGDWTLVVVTGVECLATAAERLGPRLPAPIATRLAAAAVLLGLVGGMAYLGRHDTESGHWRLAAGLVLLPIAVAIGRRLGRRPPPWRAGLALGAAWAIPLGTLLLPILVRGDAGWRSDLVRRAVGHSRYFAVPITDVERLAVWCREHTPATARFVGPPEPKTFRLWSLRSLAFNRAASPYHAAGLADWSARFRDHVAFRGTTAEFARAYLADRQALERRYRALTDAERAALARR